MVSENQTTETGVQQAENTDNSGDEMKILVLGDSIWGNYRDDTGVSARLAACLAQKGKNATIYNGAIGGTRATISPDDNEYKFGPASDCSLGKMVSILRGDTDVEMLQGKAAYDDIKAVMDVKDQIDVVILSYGMNDFLAQAPINNSDRPWTGFGTALNSGVLEIKGIFPQAQILITTLRPIFRSRLKIWEKRHSTIMQALPVTLQSVRERCAWMLTTISEWMPIMQMNIWKTAFI